MISDDNMPTETRAWAIQKTKNLIREIDDYARKPTDRAYLCSVIASGLMSEAQLHMIEIHENFLHGEG